MVRERRLAVLARFSDVVSADALVAFLASREIDAYVDGADPLSLGLGSRVRVVLAEEDLRRARWVLDSADQSDAEAWFLATGELDPGAAKEAFARRAYATGSAERIATRVGAGIVTALLLGALLLR